MFVLIFELIKSNVTIIAPGKNPADTHGSHVVTN